MPCYDDTLDIGRHIVGIFLYPVKLFLVKTYIEGTVTAIVDILHVVEHNIVHLADIHCIVCRAECRHICKFSRRVIISDNILHSHVMVMVTYQMKSLDWHAATFTNLYKISKRSLIGVVPMRLLCHVTQVHAINRNSSRQLPHIITQHLKICTTECN